MIDREMVANLIEKIDYNKILILKGARQTGKTTVLKKIKKYRAFKFQVRQHLSGNRDVICLA